MQSLVNYYRSHSATKLFFNVTSYCKHAYFVGTTRKFSDEMRFLVQSLCCNQYILVGQARLHIAHSARCMLSNICSTGRSKSWDYIIKPYFQTHQIFPAIRNALRAFHQIRCLSRYNWTPVHSHNWSMKPPKIWINFRSLQTYGWTWNGSLKCCPLTVVQEPNCINLISPWGGSEHW